MSAQFENNPDFLAYERALIRLQELAATGQDDTQEATAIGEQMDSAWKALSGEERRRLKGLSADLYMIGGQEILGGRTPPEGAGAWSQRLEQLMKQKDWERVLEHLRIRPPAFTDAHAAYARARAYDELREPEAALAFFRYAHKLEPDNPRLAIFVLNMLERAGRLEDAATIARGYLKAPERFDPRLIITAAAVLQSEIDEKVNQDTEAIHRKILTAVQQALACSVPRSFAILGHVLAAHSAFSVGELKNADQAYSEAIRLDSEDAELYAMRGQIRARLDPQAALQDFQAAITLGSTSPWPYGFVAQQAVREGDYKRAIQLSEKVLMLTDNPRPRAEALQYLAISKTELGYPTSVVRAAFERALTLDPSNPILRENQALFERRRPHQPTTASTQMWSLVEPAIPPLEDRELRRIWRGSSETEPAVAV